MNDNVIRVEGISKKFCRSIKHTMLYGSTDLTKSFLGLNQKTDRLRRGEFWAVNGVSFELKRGECLGLIGPNGSGKSTILKMLNGIFMPDKGRIEFKGRVGALIEVGAGFHPMLTGRENIFINGAILGFSKKEIDRKLDEIVDFAEIDEFIDSPVKHYSSGMLVRLGFAIAAQMEPDLLFIDEILAVGDVGFRTKCFNSIDRISKNAAVVFVSHQMPQIARLCSDIIVMEHGDAVYQSRNIPEGIEFYYSQFEGAKCVVSGSGKAVIHDVRLSSGKAEEAAGSLFKIDYNDDLFIEVTFSLDAEIREAIMNIAFFDKEMRGAAQCYSSNSNFRIINTDDTMRTRVKIPKLQLNNGVYSISIILVDERRGESLANYHALKDFQVVSSFIGFAAVQLQGEWEYV